MVLFTNGGVLHHSSVPKERLGKEAALGPARFKSQCLLGRVLQQDTLLLATARQAGLCCFINDLTAVPYDHHQLYKGKAG